MGSGDKISGRIKKAAGDLAGDRELYREGAREERKGKARDEARRARARADRKADEVRSLEHATDPDALARDHTKAQLYERARQLGVEGRSEMNKTELAAEIVRRS